MRGDLQLRPCCHSGAVMAVCDSVGDSGVVAAVCDILGAGIILAILKHFVFNPRN